MGSRKAHPKMLDDILDAIAILKDPKGSTMKRIMNQMESNYTLNKKSGKITTQPIIKALRSGVEMGLIKRNKGKFKLGLDPKDYAVYKTFQRRLKMKELCNKNKRGKKRRRRRNSSSKSGKRRHTLSMMGDGATDSESLPSTASSDMTNPEDKSKRRKRRHSRRRLRRGKGKKRRRSYTSETSDDSTRGHSSKSSRPSSRSESDPNSENKRKDESNPESEKQYHPNCGNPDCLCNVNPEERLNEDH